MPKFINPGPALWLSATLAAGCGCPPTPQEPVRLPDAKDDDGAGETGVKADGEPATTPKPAVKAGVKPAADSEPGMAPEATKAASPP